MCVFCGATPLTNEHVWPQWMRNLEGPKLVRQIAHDYGPYPLPRVTWSGDHAVLHSEVRNGRPAPMDATVKIACGRCNGGWMSRLEQRAKPVLSAMTSNDEMVLPVDDVEMIAAWSFKTAAMFQYNDPATQAVGRKEMIAFKRAQLPPSNAGVEVFRADTRTHAMRLRNVGGTAFGDGWEAKGASTLLMADRVGLLVSYQTDGFPLSAIDTPGTTRIWPSPAPLKWPLPSLRDEDFDQITESQMRYMTGESRGGI